LQDIRGLVGGRLRLAREAAGLTQGELGRRIGLGQVGWGDIERGRILVGLDHLLEACRVLGRPINFFVSDQPVDVAGLSPVVREVVVIAESLSPRDQSALLDYVRFLAQKGAQDA
jgi:transcriptional regulator with XRE-family HTH domain